MAESTRFRSLPEIARGYARTQGDKAALVAGDRRWSYAELDAESNRVARALIAAGVLPGDRVAFLDKNVPEYFSLLFGAGIVLFTQRLEAREIRPRGPHYRRMIWLFVIGALHGIFLWSGDILLTYAWCGMWIYLLRRKSARTLTTAIAPFLPFTAEKCAKMLNLGEEWRSWASGTDELADGHPLGEPEILVKKLDAKELFGEA